MEKIEYTAHNLNVNDKYKTIMNLQQLLDIRDK